MDKPELIVNWENQLKATYAWMPRCCHLCSHYDEKKHYCYKYENEVPEEFIYTLDRCPSWTKEPF